jgi:hypothetical protein
MRLQLDAFTTTSLSPEEMNPIMGGIDLLARPCKSGVDLTATTGADEDTGAGDADGD